MEAYIEKINLVNFGNCIPKEYLNSMNVFMDKEFDMIFLERIATYHLRMLHRQPHTGYCYHHNYQV